MSHENRNYTLAYVRVNEFDEQSYKNKFLQLVGGQVHVQYYVQKIPLIISHQKIKCGCNQQREFFLSKETCKIFLCKKLFEAYDQTIINFISLTNVNKNSEDDSGDDGNLQELHDSDDYVTVDGVFF